MVKYWKMFVIENPEINKITTETAREIYSLFENLLFGASQDFIYFHPCLCFGKLANSVV